MFLQNAHSIRQKAYREALYYVVKLIRKDFFSDKEIQRILPNDIGDSFLFHLQYTYEEHFNLEREEMINCKSL